jgi:hypothetical protein
MELLTNAPARWVARLAERVEARAAEEQAFRRPADARGLALGPPDLASSSNEGEILLVGQHFALQVSDAGRLLLHDLAVIPVALTRGERVAIAYRDGVGSAQPVRER